MAAPAGAGVSWPGRHRLKIVAAFAVGLLAGTSGLATAGALPNGAQEVAHRTFGAVGVKVPHGDRYQGPECGGEVKNHGQYVKSQPKEKRAEAAKSRCGKPIQAGTGDDGDSDGKAGCQGPPPWAGKGKPDPAAKEARKQACGDADKDDEGEAPAAPEAGASKVAPEEPATVTTEPPTSDTTVPGTATTTEPPTTTTTTETTTTTTGGAGEDTTSTTAAGSDGATTTTALIPGSGLGS
jgi:hypothetical protein